nr:putative 2-oxoglutarate-dependent dioxygenase [Quercus suber]
MACLDSGFFYIVNHGINQEFMDEVFAQSRRMFEQPLSEKMKHLRNEKHRGYTPILDELLDPENQLKREVARAVARIIALALDLKVEFFDQPEMLGEPIAILRLLHYEG